MAIYGHKCHYCSAPAIHQFNNGRYCCSTRTNSCPAIKQKNKTSNVKTWRDETLRNTHATTCSKSQTAKSIEQRKKTCLTRYGVPHVMYLDQTKETIKQTCLERYGTSNPQKNKKIKDKTKETCKKKYGVEYAFQSQEVVSKSKATCLARYGSEFYMKSDDFEQKSINTSLSKYGIDNASQSVEARIAAKKTMLERYGTENAFSSEVIRLKIKETLFERYGVENIAQVAEFREKAENNNPFNFKEYILPSGNMILVQGYEPLALEHLFKCGFKEYEIVTRKSLMPSIMYHFDGKQHRYYPDLFIPRLNLIIEVKSTYYFDLDKEKNLAKRAACKRLGFNFNFFIRSSNH